MRDTAVAQGRYKVVLTSATFAQHWTGPGRMETAPVQRWTVWRASSAIVFVRRPVNVLEQLVLFLERCAGNDPGNWRLLSSSDGPVFYHIIHLGVQLGAQRLFKEFNAHLCIWPHQGSSESNFVFFPIVPAVEQWLSAKIVKIRVKDRWGVN